MKDPMEPLTRRELLRLSDFVLEQLMHREAGRVEEVRRGLDGILSEFDRLAASRRQLQMAQARNWRAASGKLLQHAQSALRDLPSLVAQAQQVFDKPRQEPLLLKDILADLRQCQEELDGFQYIRESHVLSVTTDPIELEDTYLGEFRIDLDLNRLQDTRSHVMYRVVALDPHPAAGNSSVTHPHVSDDRLCEGDAYAAIGAALGSGRFFDFFCLVKGVLSTYNAGSPFVSLSDWSGICCHECGYASDADDVHYCESCSRDYCESCISYCTQCDSNVCVSCVEECSACGERMCPSCRMECPECSRTLCKTCQEESKCLCLEEKKEGDHDDQSDDQPAEVAGDEDGQPGQARRRGRSTQAA